MIILNAIISLVCTYRLLLSLQQSNYKTLAINGYNNSSLTFGLISMILAVVAMSIDLFLRAIIIFYTFGAMVLLLMVIQIYYIFRERYKKPLVFTYRLIRLIITLSIIIIAYQLLYFTEFRCLIWGIYLLLPLFIRLALLILSPIEKLNNRKYIKQAEQRLLRSKAIKIGITGSFGKTTVKNILAEILMRKYKVVVTPSSFNTPLGIARASQNITDNTEIFIAEMGARHKGDIAELAKIVRPEIGIVTGVNNQHMETFKNIDITASTKYELIEGLEGMKYAIVNSDNPYTLAMSEKGIPCELAGEAEIADYRIANIRISTYGTTFDLLYRDTTISLSTRLLGSHNAINIALCVGVAIKLGVDINDIKAAVYDLKPVAHRLELIQGTRGITIIDDTYNSNPDGAAAALRVLEAFQGRKVIVTPGLVELGDMSKEENINLGRRIADICDLIILIKSKQTAYIREGLGKLDQDKILEYKSLKEATIDFGKVLRNNDILLLLNDLPDSIGG